MVGLRNVIRGVQIAVFGVLVASVPATAADQPVMQKTFDASVERVYAAAVQAVGPTLKNTVKEACLINFQTSTYTGPGAFAGSRVIFWTAVCKDAGDGKTTVTLSAQIHSNLFGDSKAEKKDADLFWSNIDADLKSTAASGGPTASSPTPQAGTGLLAVVKISSEPSGADITIDDDYAGTTPSQLKLKPGTHAVKITKKGFESWDRSIKLEVGDSRNIAAELEKSN